MKVLLLGASGLVGSHCLELLLQNSEVDQLTVLVRKPLAQQSPRLLQIVTDFADLGSLAAHFHTDVVLCCLGTTIAKAGSKAAFEAVDVALPLKAAALAKAAGASRFGVVSAMGANSHSLFFYNRCKGMLEEGLQMLGFAQLLVVRPSLLLGNRSEKRPLEAWFQRITLPVLALLPAFWRPVGAHQVAQALVQNTLVQEGVGRILYNRQLLAY